MRPEPPPSHARGSTRAAQIGAAVALIVLFAACGDVFGPGNSVDVEIRYIATATWYDGEPVFLLEFEFENSSNHSIRYSVCRMPNPLTWGWPFDYVPDFAVEQRVSSDGKRDWETVNHVCDLCPNANWGLTLSARSERRDTAIVRASGRIRVLLPYEWQDDMRTWQPAVPVESNEITLP